MYIDLTFYAIWILSFYLRNKTANIKYNLIFVKGDSVTGHLGQKFSTRDQDNDVWSTGSCALKFKGAWWYISCYASNLNGRYLKGNHTSYADGVNWKTWTGYYYSLRFSEMKIRQFNVW